MSLLKTVGPYSIWSYGRSLVITGISAKSSAIPYLKMDGWRFNRYLKIHGEGTATPGWLKSAKQVNNIDELATSLVKYAQMDGCSRSSLMEPCSRSSLMEACSRSSPIDVPGSKVVPTSSSTKSSPEGPQLDLLWKLLHRLKDVPPCTNSETVGVQSRYGMQGHCIQITYYENGELRGTKWLTDHFKLD